MFRSQGNRQTTPRKRTTSRSRLYLEALEDRVVPAQFVDLGNHLRFLGDFSTVGTEYTANGADVSVGLKPASSEAFLPLLKFDLTAQATPGVLRFDTTDVNSFEFARAAVESVVQVGATGVPLPIWETPSGATTLTTWDVNQLLSATGLSVSAGTPFTARGVRFALTTLLFANPGGGSTDDAQVKMQGSVTFPQLASLDLSRIQATVDGGNFLITDTSGIELTGLTVALTGSASFDVFGMTAMLGNPSLTYSDAGGQDTFQFRIGASLTTKAQDNSQQSALSNVGAELEMTLADDKLTQLGFDLEGSFKIFDLSVATDAGNPLTFDFDFGTQRYEIRGGLTVTIPTATASNVDVNLGFANNPAEPGIVIQDGELTQLNATINATINLAALQITTNNNGLNFSYNRDPGQFEMFGDVTLNVPTAGSKTTSITAMLGSQGDPGLVIQDGTLQQLTMSLSGQFDLFGLRVLVSDANITYDRAGDEYEIAGTISAPTLWNATVSLGMGGSKGIVIQDGQFQLDNFAFELSQVNLGVFTVQELKVAYSRPSPAADFDLSVELFLIFPGGWGVLGEVSFVDDEVDDITLAYTVESGEGIEVADTGLFLTYIEAQIDNIYDPHNLLVSGNIAFTYGPSFDIAGQSVTLFAATGGFVVDRNHLQLDATMFLGAYANGLGPDGAPNYESVIGKGSASIDLDWGDRRYEADVSLSWYDGVLDVDGVFAFDETGDIGLAAKAELRVPHGVPFIGGKEIGEVDFLFVYHEHDLNDSFVAGWTEFKIPIIDKHIDVGIKYDIGEKSFSVIGGHEIHAFDGCFNHPDRCLDENGNYLYYNAFQTPAGATSATFSVEWPFPRGTQMLRMTLPDGTVVMQQDFLAHGIHLVPQLSSPTGSVVHVVSGGTDIPLPGGNYTFTLLSNAEFDKSQVTFASVFHYPEPTTNPLSLGPIPTDGTSLVNVTLTGTVDEGFKDQSSVSLYVAVNNDPTDRRGTPVKGATDLPITTDGKGNWTVTPSWDLSGLLPVTEYFVYAVFDDGVNTPITSDFSVGVLPVPPLDGQVTDVAPGHDNRTIAGILAYLDLNHNGRYDPGEPTSITNADGLYEFWHLTPNTPYDVGIVIPDGFELFTGNPLNTNPRTGVVYDGSHPVSAPFELIKLPSIGGTVFTDLNRDGHLDPGDKGLGNWVVYLDSNGNGQLDGGETTAVTTADGTYSFLGLQADTYTLGVDVLTTYYQTSPAPAPFYTVTIAPTAENPYPQVTGQDFGALPFVSLSGTITEYTLEDGSLSPTATPVEGQTVYLLGSAPLAINAGGERAGYYQADRGFSGGQDFSFIHPINTNYVHNPAPLIVYQTNRYAVDAAPFSYTTAGLNPGEEYWVRLHFAETFWDDPGDRIFSVAINGTMVLDHFDISAAAQAVSGGVDSKFIAVTRSFLVTADAGGQITTVFTSDTDNAQINGIEVSPHQPALAGDLAINAGGGVDGVYAGDRDFVDGQTFFNSSTIDTSLVTDPAPQFVYQTFRFGSTFAYNLTGLTPGATHLVRLHFVEHFYTQAGQRLIDVQFNGHDLLTNFDIFAAAGARDRAVVESFLVTADGNGHILIAFESPGNEALVNAIEVGGVIATTTTDAKGDYSFAGLRAGTYRVSQAQEAGTRQIAPFTSAPSFQTPEPDTNPVTIASLFGPGAQPTFVSAADFDGDGRQDFAVLNLSDADRGSYQVQIFYDGGNGNLLTLATFQDDLIQLVAGDFFGTGRQDIAVLNKFGVVHLLLNQGAGNWDNPGVNWSAGTGSVVMHGMTTGRFIGDVQHDQLAVLYQSLFFGGLTWHLDVLFVDDSGNFRSITSRLPVPGNLEAGTIVSGYLGGDQGQQVLIGFDRQSPLVGFYNGNDGFYFQSLDALPAGKTVVLGDINGDGLDEPGVYDSNALFHYVLQDQAGNFTRAFASGVGEAGHAVGTALLRDVNGDFKPDLVWVSEGVGNRALFVAVNTGQEGNWLTPTQQTSWLLAPGAQSGLFLDIADFNGDGLNDVVVTDEGGGFAEIVYNQSLIVPTPVIAEVAAANSAGNNFVNVQLGQINGRVFDDISRDGVNLLSKPPRAGVTVYVDLNRNGRLDPDEPTSVTGPDGYYAFAGLPAGNYRVRWIDEPDRRATTFRGDVHRVRLSPANPMGTALDFGNAVSADVVLTIPVDGSQDWTVAANDGRLEVIEAGKGVIFGRPLEEVYSLKIYGTNPRDDRLTIDLASGGFFAPPGGLAFYPGRGDDTLRIILSPGDNNVSLQGSRARINERLTVTWGQVEAVELYGGPGDDTYALATRNNTLHLHDDSGVDTLDFSGAKSGVGVNLSLDTGQAQPIGAGNRLRLHGVFENLFGTAFDDVLVGNAADNVLRGGAGNDDLLGEGGRDLLNAGLGLDFLDGGPDDDILIGGTTAHDHDGGALRAITAEWSSPRDYPPRVDNLIDGQGSPSRANGDVFFNASTVFDDHVTDELFGGLGRDWFLSFPTDLLLDREGDERVGW